jgi:hypothetical protein
LLGRYDLAPVKLASRKYAPTLSHLDQLTPGLAGALQLGCTANILWLTKNTANAAIRNCILILSPLLKN